MPMIMKRVKAQQLKLENFSTFVHDGFSRIDQWLLQKIHDSEGRPPIRLTLGNGVEVSPPDSSPVATIRIRDRGTLLRLVLDTEGGFVTAYTSTRHTPHDTILALLQ